MKEFRCFLLLLMFFSSLHIVHAGMLLNSTRVIYPQGKKEVTLGMENKSTEPRLIQAWIGNIDEDQSQNIPSSFVIMPPLFRVEPGKGQMLRIHFIGQDVPSDRETIYLLNILEIKPLPLGRGSATHNYLQFPVRSQLKLFYRPSGLNGTPEDAVKKISWKLQYNANNYLLECNNSSPYNISLHDVQIKPLVVDNKFRKNGMCPAKGKAKFIFQGSIDQANDTVFFSIINDYGGIEFHKANYLIQG